MTGAGPLRAEQTLVELAEVGRRSRRAAVSGLTRLPLMAWGIAWAVGYPLLDRARWTVALPVGLALAAAALLASWLFRTRQTTSGWERRSQAGWLVLMVGSPFLVAVVTPLPRPVIALFLGALWGIALVLLAVAIGDRPLGVVGALILLAAAVCRIVGVHHPLTVFGLVAGAAMLALGGWRIGRHR